MRSHKICPVRNFIDTVRKLKFLGIADVSKFAVFHQQEIIFGRQIFQRQDRGVGIEIGDDIDMGFQRDDMRANLFRQFQKFLGRDHIGGNNKV